LSSQQEASARQLAQQLKTADAIIKELEGAAVSLQNQLAAEVERADGYSKELQR
jgi:ribosome-binding protein aMBF1 (putative translation factor)